MVGVTTATTSSQVITSMKTPAKKSMRMHQTTTEVGVDDHRWAAQLAPMRAVATEGHARFS
jgi:hypothetical protein